MNFLNSSLWQSLVNIIISTLAVLAAIVIPVLIYVKQKKRKEITCKIITPRLFYIFPSSQLVILKLWNSGNTPIIPNDYDEPITLNINKGNIKGFKFLESTHEKLEKSVKVYCTKIIVEPILLNVNDIIKIELLIDNWSEFMLNAHSRIIDLDSIKIKFAVKIPVLLDRIVSINIIISSLYIGIFLSDRLVGLNELISQIHLDFVLPISIFSQTTLKIRPVTILVFWYIGGIIYGCIVLILVCLITAVRILIIDCIRKALYEVIKQSMLELILRIMKKVKINKEWYKEIGEIIKDERDAFEVSYKTPEDVKLQDIFPNESY